LNFASSMAAAESAETTRNFLHLFCIGAVSEN
jgi:hypothetical protein